MMKTKCFGLRPITGAASDQCNVADVGSPDAAPVVPMTSRNVSQPQRAGIKERRIEDQVGDKEACKHLGQNQLLV